MCYLCWKDTTKANNITFLGLMVSIVNPHAERKATLGEGGKPLD